MTWFIVKSQTTCFTQALWATAYCSHTHWLTRMMFCVWTHRRKKEMSWWVSWYFWKSSTYLSYWLCNVSLRQAGVGRFKHTCRQDNVGSGSLLIFAHFFFAGEPKLGVYMLNSGSKKLFVKVRLFSSLTCLSCACHRCQFTDLDQMIYFPPGYAGAIKSRGQPRVQSGSAEIGGEKLYWSGCTCLQRWKLNRLFTITLRNSLRNLPEVKFSFIIYAVVSCVRFIARPWENVHQSYQFKDSGKPDNPQLPWATYHTQVTLRRFAISYSRCWRASRHRRLN